MIRTTSGVIVTGEPITAQARAFYATVIDPSGKQYRLGIGPFDTEPQAREHVDLLRAHCAPYADHVWFAYGTAGVTGDAPYQRGIFCAHPIADHNGDGCTHPDPNRPDALAFCPCAYRAPAAQ